jgi:hypothetical protein
METGDSLPCIQEPCTGFCSEPHSIKSRKITGEHMVRIRETRNAHNILVGETYGMRTCGGNGRILLAWTLEKWSCINFMYQILRLISFSALKMNNFLLEYF